MKKIRVWKVLVLSIVTCGVYLTVWFVLRRNEMVKKYKVSIPHWWWFVIPSLLLTPLSIYCLIMPIAPYDTTLAIVSCLMILVFMIVIWWLWQFGRAVEKVIQGRITLGWTIAYICLLGPLLLQGVLQYYFNRLPENSETRPKKYQPSRRFVQYSVAAMVISVVLTTALCAALLVFSGSSWQLSPTLTKEQYSNLSKSNELLMKYNDCIAKLDEDFPAETASSALTEKYNKAYDACEAIRIEQNAASDKYNKSIEQQ